MKVRVIKLAGQTGFRAIGTEYEVPNMQAKVLIKAGMVEDAAVASPAPAPKRKPSKKTSK